MNYSLTLWTCLMLIATAQSVVAQDLNWAYSIMDDNVQDAAGQIASNGNAFAVFGTTSNNVTADFKNGSEAFNSKKNWVAKYDETAEIQWVIEQPGGGSFGYVSAIHMDDAGNVYAVGKFAGTLDFDPSSEVQNFSSVDVDAFVQKLDADGNLVWVGYTTTKASPSEVAMKSNGNLVIIGRSQDPSTATLFDGSTVALEKGIFIVEFAPNGDAIGAYSIPTPDSFSTALALAIDDQDNVYIGASVDGAMDLDCGPGTLDDVSISGYDAVIVKYDSNFNYQWHKVFGDQPTSGPDGWDGVGGMVCDASGNLYAAGHFTWTTDFDPVDNPELWVLEAGTSAGSQTPDGFVIKYAPDGTIQWIQEAGGHPSIAGNTDVNFYDIILAGDQVVVTGDLNGGADFDGSDNDFIVNSVDGALSICYASYSTQGEFMNAWIIDGNLANEYVSGLDNLANGFVTFGTFQKICDMDPTADNYYLQTDSLGAFYSADNDLFIARYDLDGVSQIPSSRDDLAQVNAYPNPSENGVFTLQITGRMPRYTVYTAEGQLLIGQGRSPLVDLSRHPSGLYLVVFESAHAPLKLVKF